MENSGAFTPAILLRTGTVRGPAVAVSRSTLFSKVSFHKSYSQRFGIWRADQFEHVGAMLLDLSKVMLGIIGRMGATHRANNLQPAMSQATQGTGMALSFVAVGPIEGGRDKGRSEEHTSELQSLTNLVCRLLLEKKKK